MLNFGGVNEYPPRKLTNGFPQNDGPWKFCFSLGCNSSPDWGGPDPCPRKRENTDSKSLIFEVLSFPFFSVWNFIICKAVTYERYLFRSYAHQHIIHLQRIVPSPIFRKNFLARKKTQPLWGSAPRQHLLPRHSSEKSNPNIQVRLDGNFHESGQIIIFHQPGFPWNKGISLTKPPFGVRSCEVAIIWPDG